jgi:putative ABC transport system permease protein
MDSHSDPLALRICVGLIRAASIVVPGPSRQDWRDEWEAEVRHRWDSLDARERLDWRIRMDLFRRVLGSLPDAAWLRRQFTADADLVHDVKHGLRMLWKSPSFALASVLILALGIGGTVSIAALLDTLLFRPLPYQDADRVVTIWQQPNARPLDREDIAPADFLDWRDRARSFSNLAGVIPYSRDYTGGTEPEVLFGAQVTEGFFDAIGMPPMIGRGFLPEEHKPGGRRAVVISYGFWQSHFAGDPNVTSKTLSLGGDLWPVVGVLPKAFAPQILPRPGELTVWTPKVVQDYEKRIRASAWWNVIGKLAPGVTIAQAQSEMDAIAADLAKQYPRTNASSRPVVVSMREHLTGGVSVPLFLMLVAVVLVFGIGCANVASLLLARGIERSREFAIRTALGAGRTRLIRQLIAESLLLSFVAAIVGVGLAQTALKAIVALAPSGLIRLQNASIDGRMLLFTVALTLVTACIFALIPALQFSDRSREMLRERQMSGVRTSIRRGLVASEVALALVLLVCAGLLVRSFERLLAVDPGFKPTNVVMVQVFAGRQGDIGRVRNFFTSTLDRIRSLPGVESAGAVSAMPFALSNINIRSDLDIVGRPAPRAEEQRTTYVTIATPGYFSTLSIPLREGRLLEDRDTETASPVAVISDALRRREWPNESPVGKRIRVQWNGQPVETKIVGVVGQVRHESLTIAPRPEVFLPFAQQPFSSMTYVVKSAETPAALFTRIKHQIWAVDPRQSVYDTAALESLVQQSLVRQRFSMTVITGFAVLALVLCASGIYGIVSFTTSQRTREIGVRMALGADAPMIRRMVLREGSMVILVGLVAGVLGALVGSRFLQTLLFEIAPSDPVTMVAVSVTLGLVGLAACYVPARRATRVDPLTALRTD